MEQGLDATLQHLTTESPDWMAVYFEVLRRLRRRPELMKEWQARGGRGRDAQGKGRLRELHPRGRVPPEVQVADRAAFRKNVAKGAGPSDAPAPPPDRRTPP